MAENRRKRKAFTLNKLLWSVTNSECDILFDMSSSVSFSQTRARITLILEFRWPAQNPIVLPIAQHFRVKQHTKMLLIKSALLPGTSYLYHFLQQEVQMAAALAVEQHLYVEWSQHHNWGNTLLWWNSSPGVEVPSVALTPTSWQVTKKWSTPRVLF